MFLNKFEEAQTYCRQSLEIHREIVGEMDPKTADSYQEVGLVLLSLGQIQEGLTYTQKAQKIRRDCLLKTMGMDS